MMSEEQKRRLLQNRVIFLCTETKISAMSALKKRRLLVPWSQSCEKLADQDVDLYLNLLETFENQQVLSRTELRQNTLETLGCATEEDCEESDELYDRYTSLLRRNEIAALGQIDITERVDTLLELITESFQISTEMLHEILSPMNQVEREDALCKLVQAAKIITHRRKLRQRNNYNVWGFSLVGPRLEEWNVMLDPEGIGTETKVDSWQSLSYSTLETHVGLRLHWIQQVRETLRTIPRYSCDAELLSLLQVPKDTGTHFPHSTELAGGFGQVYVVHLKDLPAYPLIIKQVRFDKYRFPYKLAWLRFEVWSMLMANLLVRWHMSPHFPLLVEPFFCHTEYDSYELNLILEKSQGSLVSTSFNWYETHIQNTPLMMSMMFQILSALVTIFTTFQIINLDVYSRNILYDEIEDTIFQYILDQVTYSVRTHGFLCKVADWGLATGVGTQHYLPTRREAHTLQKTSWESFYEGFISARSGLFGPQAVRQVSHLTFADNSEPEVEILDETVDLLTILDEVQMYAQHTNPALFRWLSGAKQLCLSQLRNHTWSTPLDWFTTIFSAMFLKQHELPNFFAVTKAQTQSFKLRPLTEAEQALAAKLLTVTSAPPETLWTEDQERRTMNEALKTT